MINKCILLIEFSEARNYGKLELYMSEWHKIRAFARLNASVSFENKSYKEEWMTNPWMYINYERTCSRRGPPSS